MHSDNLWELFDSVNHKTHSATTDGAVVNKKYLTNTFVPRAHEPIMCCLYIFAKNTYGSMDNHKGHTMIRDFLHVE